MLKQLTLIMFSLAVASAQVKPLITFSPAAAPFISPDNWFKWDWPTDADRSVVTFGDKDETIVLRSGGKQTAPAISLRNEGQAFYLAALKSGAILSLYRQVGSEKREWLRLSAAGITVMDEATGELVKAYTGRIEPGCAAVVKEGIVTGQDCEPARKLAAKWKALEEKYPRQGTRTFLITK